MGLGERCQHLALIVGQRRKLCEEPGRRHIQPLLYVSDHGALVGTAGQRDSDRVVEPFASEELLGSCGVEGADDGARRLVLVGRTEVHQADQAELPVAAGGTDHIGLPYLEPVLRGRAGVEYELSDSCRVVK